MQHKTMELTAAGVAGPGSISISKTKGTNGFITCSSNITSGLGSPQAADCQKLGTQSQTLLLNILPRYLLPATVRDLCFDAAQPLFWHCTTDFFLV